jgi:hypothetical protein
MRANMKLIVLLGMLILAAPAFAAARPTPVPPSRPTSNVYLRDWADQHGFKMSFDPKSLNILLTNRWANIELLANSKRGSINGVTVWLSFPIRVFNGRLMIHQKDLATLLDPILYPKRLPGNRPVRLVALDAGHGGRDPGYQIGNHEEKKYTLPSRERSSGSARARWIKSDADAPLGYLRRTRRTAKSRAQSQSRSVRRASITTPPPTRAPTALRLMRSPPSELSPPMAAKSLC